MQKFFILCLSKSKMSSTGKIKVEIYRDDFIEKKGEEIQMLGFFEYRADAELARDALGETQLVSYWGRNTLIEVRNGRVAFANAARKKQLFAIFVRG